MRVVEEFGKTVAEAREKAFKQLGIKSPDDAGVEVEVLDEGSPGNDLGWGRKFARIKVTVRGEVEAAPVVAPVAEEDDDVEDEEDVIDEEEDVIEDEEDVIDEEEDAIDAPAAARPVARAASAPAARKPRQKAVDDHEFDEAARDMLEEILDLMRLHVTVEEDESADGQTVLNIVGPDQGILIGKHGQTLDSLQFILNLIVNKEATERRRVILDAGGYRLRREKTLKDLARRMARRALEERVQIALEPMSPAERRIIHLALADDPDIETFSEGDEPGRKVIISPRR